VGCLSTAGVQVGTIQWRVTEDYLETGDGIAVDSRWTFAGQVSDHFDEHVARSVPLYQDGHELVARLSDFFVRPDSVVYDVGCSTGTLTAKLATRHLRTGARFVAVDIEPSMASKTRQRCADLPNVEVVEGDATQLTFERSDLVVLYYTLQFVRPDQRQLFVSAVYEALNEGGALVLFEKVLAPSAPLQDLMQQLYVEFKLAGGYTAQEIVAKSRSLKAVLQPLTTARNVRLLERAGFGSIMTIQKYVSFEGILAIR
jgi:tRNA (cmo5U34)-methyltransferase